MNTRFCKWLVSFAIIFCLIVFTSTVTAGKPALFKTVVLMRLKHFTHLTLQVKYKKVLTGLHLYNNQLIS